MPAEPIGGSMEDLGKMKEEEASKDEEESENLFQEISRWVESTQCRFHSPSPSPSSEQRSCYTSSPPLPLSPTDPQTPVFQYTEVVDHSSAEDEQLSLFPSLASSYNNLPSLFPSSPTGLLSPDVTERLLPSDTLHSQHKESQPPSSTSSLAPSVKADSLESLPVKHKERLLDLDAFISRALQLCRQNKEKANGKNGQDAGWMEESKQNSIKRKVPKLPEHRTSTPQTPNY